MNDQTIDDEDDGKVVLDKKALDQEAIQGAKAFTRLSDQADDAWISWSQVILGLRALRTLAFDKAGVNDIASWHYRQQFGALLELKKYAAYANIDKQTRSTAYKLMDRLEEIDAWYQALPIGDKLRWRHPDAIAKHCPKHLLKGGMGHNKPKKVAAKKPVVSAEIERLRAIVLQLVKRLAKYEPDALELLDQIHLTEPDDPVDDLFAGPESEPEEA